MVSVESRSAKVTFSRRAFNRLLANIVGARYCSFMQEVSKTTRATKKAHCPACDGERNCEVHGKVCKAWDWEDRQYGHSINGGVEHYLLECKGCETVFYETSSWNSEDIDQYYDKMGRAQYDYRKEVQTYPKSEIKTKPVWFDAMQKVDSQLHNILNQMYVAHDNQAHILTAIGLRTALDRATEVLDVDPAKTFVEKLDALFSKGWIGQTERDILMVVTDAGNAAAHRGWEPDSRAISELLSALEVFLHRAFIVGLKALRITSSIPAKPKRMPSNGQDA